MKFWESFPLHALRNDRHRQTNENKPCLGTEKWAVDFLEQWTTWQIHIQENDVHISSTRAVSRLSLSGRDLGSGHFSLVSNLRPLLGIRLICPQMVEEERKVMGLDKGMRHIALNPNKFLGYGCLQCHY